MSKTQSISIDRAMQALKFLPDRTPTTSDAEAEDAFASLADYRDGAIFIGYYAGNSEWERHSKGDEIVMVVEGETSLIMLQSGEEVASRLSANELIVVPQNTWHRFETPKAVRILTVTPQPTDHSLERPGD